MREVGIYIKKHLKNGKHYTELLAGVSSFNWGVSTPPPRGCVKYHCFPARYMQINEQCILYRPTV